MPDGRGVLNSAAWPSKVLAIVSTLVCVAVFLFLVVGVAVLLFLVFAGKGKQTGSREGPSPQVATTSRDTAYMMRFGIDHADGARALVRRFGGQTLGGRDAREAALALVRAAPEITHAYVGPSYAEAPAQARCHTSGGILLGFRVRTQGGLDDVSDDRDASAIAGSLRHLTTLPESAIVGAMLAEARPSDGAQMPALEPVTAASAPGQVLCRFCGKPMASYETTCPTCGGLAPT